MLASTARFGLSLSAILVAVLVSASSASAGELHLQGWGSTATPLATDEQMVFNYDETLPPSDCRWSQFPDAPPRAFRDSSGQTQLILANTLDDRTQISPVPPGATPGGGFNFRMTGSDLDPSNLSVEPGCHTIFGSGMESAPDQFNNQEWLTSPYTPDGQTVYALVHNEYHGWRYPGMCNTQGDADPIPVECWYNAITLAKSTDSGANYSHVNAPPDHRVATFPYKYDDGKKPADPSAPDTGPAGYFQPSNIIQKDGWYYALIKADNGNDHYPQQRHGACLIRTRNLDDPTSWRAWDGQGFSVTFINPYEPSYNDSVDPETNHLCTPVSPDPTSGTPKASDFKAGTMTQSLTYNTYFGRYLLVGFAEKPDATDPHNYGVYYSTSSDLIHWSERKLLARAIPPNRYRGTPQGTPPTCDPAEDPVAQFAVLDPNSTDRNYGTTGQVNELYYVRFHYSYNPSTQTCTGSSNRDLVRIPFRFQFHPGAKWATGGMPGCPGAFDAANPALSGIFLPSADHNYSGNFASYKADLTSTAPTDTQLAYGYFDRDGSPPATCDFSLDRPDRAPLAFGEGDEVWYSGAFLFPRTGFWDRLGSDGKLARVTIMALEGGAPGWASRLVVNNYGYVLATTNDGTATTQFIPTGSVSIPKDDCWHFFEVHQKLSATQGQALTEIWIDHGPFTNPPNVPPVATSSAPNLPPGATLPYNTLKAGIVVRYGAANVLLYTDMDGFGYNGPLSYGGCGG